MQTRTEQRLIRDTLTGSGEGTAIVRLQLTRAGSGKQVARLRERVRELQDNRNVSPHVLSEARDELREARDLARLANTRVAVQVKAS